MNHIVKKFQKISTSIITTLSGFSEQKIDKIANVIIFTTFVFLSILSIFRFPLYDERLYLHETSFMYSLLKNGVWFGNYGVGVHGFLFKLPVALIYLITGPSVFIATFFHVILATITIYLFYKILKENFGLKRWALIGLILFITNFQFISYSITFHRETPILFALMLFTKWYLDKKKVLFQSFALLLILDAKEYVFPIIVLAIFISELLQLLKENVSTLIKIISIFKKCLVLLLPSIVYLSLMFTSSIIPLNITLARITGLAEDSLSYGLKHISPTTNYWKLDNGVSTKVLRQSTQDANTMKKVFNVFLVPIAYIEKVFYITRFSFQSIPLILIIPALISSYTVLKKSKKTVILIPTILFIYTTIHIIKVSHQRYLYPFLPFYIALSTLFLKNLSSSKITNRTKKIVFYISSTIFLILVLFPQYNNIKKLYEILATGILLLILYILHTYKTQSKTLAATLAGFFIVSNILINSFALATKSQLQRSITWGINGEVSKIADMVDETDVIYLNHTGTVNGDWLANIDFYRSNPNLKAEFKRELRNWVPKKSLLKTYDKPNTYQGLEWQTADDLKKLIEKNGIEKVLMAASTKEGVEFYNQDQIYNLKQESWLKLQNIKKLKNKEVHNFKVLNE